MAKSLKKVQACPIHQAILEECVERLNSDKKSFSFHDVLVSLDYQLMGNAIAWNRIQEWLISLNYEIIPMADAFFTMPSKKRAHMSEADKVKFICVGYGKGVAGYARTTVEGGVPSVLWGNHKIKISNGTLKASKRFAENAAGENTLENPTASTTKRLKQMKRDGQLLGPQLLVQVDPPPPPPKADGSDAA